MAIFSGTYPLIYSHPWSSYIRIHYIRAHFQSPYLSHITRSTCTMKYDKMEGTHTQRSAFTRAFLYIVKKSLI